MTRTCFYGGFQVNIFYKVCFDGALVSISRFSHDLSLFPFYFFKFFFEATVLWLIPRSNTFQFLRNSLGRGLMRPILLHLRSCMLFIIWQFRSLRISSNKTYPKCERIIEDSGPARKLCICPERTQSEMRPDASALVAIKRNHYSNSTQYHGRGRIALH